MAPGMIPADPAIKFAAFVEKTGRAMLWRLGLETPPPSIHHDPRTTAYPHECHPLIWADCAGCHQPYSLCAQVTDEAVGQIMDGAWRCWPCEVTG